MASSKLSKEYVQDSSSDNEARTKSGQRNNGIHTTKKQAARNKELALLEEVEESTEGSESESSTTSSESSSVTSDSADMTTNTNGIKRKSGEQNGKAEPVRKKSRQGSGPAHIPSMPFNVPKGYEPIRAVASDQIHMFDTNDLASKQVWHITAPASVPLTRIKTLDIQAALRGEAILEHNGTKFNMQAILTKPEALLLPSGTDLTYSKINVPVVQNLCIKEMTQVEVPKKSIPDDTKGQATLQGTEPNTEQPFEFTASEVGTKRTPRKQPSGLLMRYHPYGSSKDGKERLDKPDQDDNEQESGNATADAFVAPPELPADLGDDATPTTPKRVKKSGKRDERKSPTLSQSAVNKDPDTMDIGYTYSSGGMTQSPEKKRRKKEKKQKSA